MSAFNDTAQPLLGISANELVEIKDRDLTAYGKYFQDAQFKSYTFKVRAKMENYQVR